MIPLRLLHLFFLILLSFSSIGQNQGNIWYFGENAGIDFNSGAPVALTNSAMNTIEGCASICDANGDILFYTNGISIWDSNHTIMPNGSGLLGDESSTQSSIVVPNPLTDSLYYVFTVGENGGNGLRYSEVNMSLNNGFGDIVQTTKNTLLLDENNSAMNVTEKITSVLHADNKSFWVIAHQASTNKFYVYLIDTITGLIPLPTAWTIGSNHVSNWGATHGYMKVSPGGEYIAAAVHSLNTSGFFEVFDFNRATGEISNPRTALNYYRPYGVEFSPDGKNLYATSCSFSPGSTPSVLYQFDMEAVVFSASATVVHSSSTQNMLGLQLGPDGKIYVAINYNTYLGVINEPNETAASCNYINNGVSLNGNDCRYGLPTFIQSFFGNARISATGHCQNTDILFEIFNSEGILSIEWDFDDPASGTNNYSTLLQPNHVYSMPGNYTVSAILTYFSYIDTITVNLDIYPSPVVNLGNDTTLAAGDSILLSTGSQQGDIFWNTGESTEDIFVYMPGVYSVTITNQWECEAFDEISITTLGITGKDKTEIRIYPNPATDYLRIINPSEKKLQCTVFDSSGNPTLYKIISNANSYLDINQLKQGTYFILLSNRDFTISYKIVKL